MLKCLLIVLDNEFCQKPSMEDTKWKGNSSSEKFDLLIKIVFNFRS